MEAVMVPLKVPSVVGVPESEPPEESERPGGSPEAEKVTGAVPEAVTRWE